MSAQEPVKRNKAIHTDYKKDREYKRTADQAPISRLYLYHPYNQMEITDNETNARTSRTSRTWHALPSHC